MKTTPLTPALVTLAAALLCGSCSKSAPASGMSPASNQSQTDTTLGLSGVYYGKNTLGFEYKIEFISATDCIVHDPRRGQWPATYRVVGEHIILTAPGGEADVVKQGDTLTFSDDGYAVVLNKVQ